MWCCLLFDRLAAWLGDLIEMVSASCRTFGGLLRMHLRCLLSMRTISSVFAKLLEVFLSCVKPKRPGNIQVKFLLLAQEVEARSRENDRWWYLEPILSRCSSRRYASDTRLQTSPSLGWLWKSGIGYPHGIRLFHCFDLNGEYLYDAVYVSKMLLHHASSPPV